jgi:hypothetical protein
MSVLKANLKATVDIGIASTFCATFKSILYFETIHFHQPKMSNLSSLESS